MPTPLVVGFGAACDIARQEMAADAAHIRRWDRTREMVIWHTLRQNAWQATYGMPSELHVLH